MCVPFVPESCCLWFLCLLICLFLLGDSPFLEQPLDWSSQSDLFSGCSCHMMNMGVFVFLSLPLRLSRPVICLHYEPEVVLEGFHNLALSASHLS